MPLQKDFKRLVRSRMAKTGESYTAARANLIRKRPSGSATIRPPTPDHAKLAGMSDAAIEAKTGRTWAGWVAALDDVGAHAWPHARIARCVHEQFHVGAWWGQSVTVGYERIKGLREIGQRRSGAYEASRSKTIAAPVEQVYSAFTDARVRRRWLPGVKLTVRTASANKSVRITWEDKTSVEVWLTPNGEARTAAAVTHTKLTGKEDAVKRKEYWGERLAVLAGMLK